MLKTEVKDLKMEMGYLSVDGGECWARWSWPAMSKLTHLLVEVTSALPRTLVAVLQPERLCRIIECTPLFLLALKPRARLHIQDRCSLRLDHLQTPPCALLTWPQPRAPARTHAPRFPLRARYRPRSPLYLPTPDVLRWVAPTASTAPCALAHPLDHATHSPSLTRPTPPLRDDVLAPHYHQSQCPSGCCFRAGSHIALSSPNRARISNRISRSRNLFTNIIHIQPVHHITTSHARLGRARNGTTVPFSHDGQCCGSTRAHRRDGNEAYGRHYQCVRRVYGQVKWTTPSLRGVLVDKRDCRPSGAHACEREGSPREHVVGQMKAPPKRAMPPQDVLHSAIKTMLEQTMRRG
ncbi:unnamed protein product [Trichogramma brassicae]|uniref:Uncharacterized protein n=1 Tax=Trichogramma brassicae TaxID=86971 RepID=A0A6H5I5F5_9HYME|nr:unnamed protein product [Trichogramma brassicae]